MLGLPFVLGVIPARIGLVSFQFSVEGQGGICADVGEGTRAEAQATGEG